MELSMVNSSSFGLERNGNTIASYMATNGLHNKTSSSPLTASSAIQSKNEFIEAVDKTHAAELVPSSTKLVDRKDDDGNYSTLSQKVNNLENNEARKTLFCSFPLEKVQTFLSKYISSKSDGNKTKVYRKILCLYCDRTFVNINLRQKHVERCHSSKHLRRVSLRKNQNFLTRTPCIYCDKFTSTEHTLNDLFKHLIENHSNKYFGCLSCEIRFLNSSHFTEHNVSCHNAVITQKSTSSLQDLPGSLSSSPEKEEIRDEIVTKTVRKKQKAKILGVSTNSTPNVEESTKTYNTKNLRSKKLSVKSSRIIVKRSKRLQAKLTDTTKKKRTREFNEKKKNDRLEQPFNSKGNEKPTKTTTNPYPEFDHFFQVKKITDHSIDNLKISSLTFDDVFDKAFFNRIQCNIQENLLHHIDGKLFKNEESESRISNFEKISNIPQEMQNLNVENYGCELSLNAIAPTTLLLSNQLGDDPESQIEYGSKPSKKKTQMRKDEVHYKYFTRRKYQASILEHKENRDLSKLDMWTQYVIKNRQQKIIDDKKSPKEILDYFAGEEYKSMMKREELNRILDRRGPFEDLREEASKKAALDKLNDGNHCSNDDQSAEIGELLNDILNKVFELTEESRCVFPSKNKTQLSEDNITEIPSYLNLRPTTDVIPENEIDRSDKIALICSSQETENFELPSNTVRGKNEKVELTGEWARSRIYVCAACGLKLQNIKQFLEHKSANHQYIWVQHYEFVGNQSELYRHLSIPVLGKVGVLEEIVQCKVWKRSEARLCTKCGKQCNSLGELHRHILECGGDWTWMLARKKCKYRPFGAKSRRKRRGLVKRIYAQKTKPSEKKLYKKTYDLPRSKPSDADTIKRMLANLPAKRATRKIISLKDGFGTSRTRQVKATRQSKFKCGKLIRGKVSEQSSVIKPEFNKSKNQNNSYRRSLRCLNKVLTSRILDSNSSIIVRRKYTRKLKKEQEKKEVKADTQVEEKRPAKVVSKKVSKANGNFKTQSQNDKRTNNDLKSKRSSSRIEKRSEFTTGSDNINIKHFFPVKKKNKIIINENEETEQESKVSQNESKEVGASPKKSKSSKNLTPQVEKVKDEPINNGVNLRKRKNGHKNVEISIAKKKKGGKPAIANNTRKFKNGTKSIVLESKVHSTTDEKKLENNNETKVETFFEKSMPEEAPKLVDSKNSNLTESRVEDQADKSKTVHINDSLEEKNLQTENKNNKKDDLTLQTLNCPQVRKRIKKPTRGLNDCIAMLTSKLGRSFEESTTRSIFSDEESARIPKTQPTNMDRNSDYILKVPFSSEHFRLRSRNSESRTSGSDIVQKYSASNYNFNDAFIQLNEIETNVKNVPEVYDMVVKKDQENKILGVGMNNHGEDNSKDMPTEGKSLVREQLPKEAEEMLSEIQTEKQDVNDVIEPSLTNTFSESRYDTDSDDEIPLSDLLRDEQFDQSMSSVNNKDEDTLNNMDEDFQASLISSVTEQIHLMSEKVQYNSVADNVNICEHTTFATDLQETEEKQNPISDNTLTKDCSSSLVLIEISDNLCEIAENITFDNKIRENNVEELQHTPTDLTTENKDNNDKQCFLNVAADETFVSLGKRADAYEDVANELEKSEFSDAKRLKIDVSEYKENSVTISESSVGKQKQKKKFGRSSKTSKKNKPSEDQDKQSTKENSDSQHTDAEKTSRSAKAKALESMLDDVLLELSENEFLQENLKNIFTNDTVLSDSQKKVTKKTTEKHMKNNTNLSKKEKTEIREPEAQTCLVNNEESFNEEPIRKFTDNPTVPSIQQSMTKAEVRSDGNNGTELRRSSRNSKRVTSYNETDLIDPLLDDFDNEIDLSKLIKETARDILGIKRKSRKLISQKKATKNGQNEKKLTGEELFDLLKATPNENVLSKPTEILFNTFDEISNDFNDNNFDVFEDILEKSIAVIDENLSEQPVSKEPFSNNSIIDKISNSNSNRSESVSEENVNKSAKRKSKKNKLKLKSQNKLMSFENSVLNSPQNVFQNDSELTGNSEFVNKSNAQLSEEKEVKPIETDMNKIIYCEICDKSFCRLESLTKHKRTLTHISKLSVLEASEANQKAKTDELSTNEETEQMSSDSRKELNLLNMLENAQEECEQYSPFAVNVSNSNLKLADIINDVLNKPMLKKNENDFSEIVIHNEKQTLDDVRRCKSLAERKSFESDNCLNNAKNDFHTESVDYFDSEVANTVAGTILEKQITLLENIIEHRSGLGYIDQLSVSSSSSAYDNLGCTNEIEAAKRVESIPDYSEYKKENSIKPNIEESFLKPIQYEEISEDSNLRNYDEQKSRKVLNRDEELFLECCSLLKSGSEMSSYSKKSNNPSKDLNNAKYKPGGEQEWLKNNCLTQKENDDFVESCSDSSRMRTPLGDSFSQEDSDSATVASHWDKRKDWEEDLNLTNRNLTFEDVFNKKTNEDIFYKESVGEEFQPVVSSFDHVISEDIMTERDVRDVLNETVKQSSVTDPEEVSRTSCENNECKHVIDGKKMLTKGAMKIFEGLKVSIPTEELNIDKILTSGISMKTSIVDELDLKNAMKESVDNTVKSPENSWQLKEEMSFKERTKSASKTNFKKQRDLQLNSKVHDVYDFEETQDNSDVFTRPDFRSFRTHNEKSRKPDKLEGSDDDSQDCTDSLGFDAVSSSTSSISEVLPQKPRTEQSITKKKCMIMGRIFKNAVKSRIVDEDIRNIPEIDNTKLVEDFVFSCPPPIVSAADKKPRMTEDEMNLAFDKLLNSRIHESKHAAIKAYHSQSQHKTNVTKRKQKNKTKKRSSGYGSDSSGDEFKLQRYSKKRCKKTNNNTEESCINLEQELRECIGVASRKSQRKCTSGKQNVLMEYWSSDESLFEAMLETQNAVSMQKMSLSNTDESKKNSLQNSECKETKSDLHNASNFENNCQNVSTELPHRKVKATSPTVNRRKRVAANPLYHWSSSSEDESRDLIVVRPLREELEDDEDRPVQHGWIVGDSPKKLVTMLAQAKGKKCDVDSVKEQGRKKTSAHS